MIVRPSRVLKSWLPAAVATAVLLTIPHSDPALAQEDTRGLTGSKYRELINANTITILGASLTGSYIKIVDDIAKAVNDGHKLRVLPIIGEGGSQNIRDIMYLRNVDAGIVMSTSLDLYEKEPLFQNLRNKLQYIAKLYQEEIHVVARPEVSSIFDLANQRVAFHGGAYVSGQLLFDKLGIRRAESVKMNFFDGLEKLKTGEIAAIVRATASPMKDFDASFDPRYHRLVPIEFDPSIVESFAPARLRSEQYPRAIAAGQTVNTVAIGVVLAAYAWRPGTDRYRRVEQFVNAFFSKYDKLLQNPKRHRKWDDVNLAAEMPGWTRFSAAQEWLDKNRPVQPSANLRQEFETFLAGQGAVATTPAGEAEKDRLFQEFMEWRRRNKVN